MVTSPSTQKIMSDKQYMVNPCSCGRVCIDTRNEKLITKEEKFIIMKKNQCCICFPWGGQSGWSCMTFPDTDDNLWKM